MHIKTIIIFVSFSIFSTPFFAQNKKGYRLVWHDNFSSPTIDTSSWTHEIAEPGWVNGELQYYTNAKNVCIKNGKLILTARNDSNKFSSSRLITKNKRIFTYGIVQIRAKLPAGKGTWPALWMLGNNIDQVSWPACGEIDIMEHVGRDKGVVHSSIHNNSGFGATPYTSKINVINPYNKFHVYSAKWTENQITFYVDNKVVYNYKPTTLNDSTWPFNKPAYLILNIAIGGTWGGQVDQSIFPTSMIIDWIKVYQK